MVEVHDKQSCPTCGQSCNVRIESLNKQLVWALFRVAQYVKANKIDRPIKRSDFSHLFSGHESNTANFAKLVWFAPQFFKNADLGGYKEGSHYHFNIPEIDKFFAKESTVATEVEVDPLYKVKGVPRYLRKEPRYINQIPNLRDFLNEEEEYIVTYLADRTKENVQQTLQIGTL